MTAPAGGHREKVVILGGGMAALTTAMELSRPGWRDRFDSITVYQLGWRLGGKGASGRGPNGRIEEHGLHLWLGFYENAFRLLRECYEELGRPAGAPLARWDEAFTKASLVVLEEWHDGVWKSWPIQYPEDDKVPGLRADGEATPTLWDYVKRGLQLMIELARGAGVPVETPRDRILDALGHVSGPLGALTGAVATALRNAESTALATALVLAMRLHPDPATHARRHHAMLADLVDAFLGFGRHARAVGDQARRTWMLLEIAAAHVRGILRDGVLTHPDGLSILDDRDYVEWLHAHGASEAALESPVLRGGYDLVFAFRDGDPARPALAAGQALRGTLRFFFGYKGAIFWKMEAGMGDVVFAPIYEVLKRRGVEFRFFHRVKALRLSADRRSVAAVEIARQVKLAGADYDPLVDVKGLPCWPSEPCWEQIQGGAGPAARNLESFWAPTAEVGELTLRAGEHFDRLVFGISLGAVPYLCKELVEDNQRWREMVDHVATVHTQAFQLWLDADAAQLGWTLGQADLSNYLEPFDTFADMRQLIPREDWPAGAEPRSIAYFCNTMPTSPGLRQPPDPGFAADAAETVRANAVTFLRKHIGPIWPRAVDSATGDFRWGWLTGGGAASGEARFASQFWRANVDPSERYVQSLPDTDRYRLETDGTGYDNLYVVGDWIDCKLNVGCVEAAVMSGMLASHAITGMPRREDIIGYDHP